MSSIVDMLLEDEIIFHFLFTYLCVPGAWATGHVEAENSIYVDR